MVLKHFRRKLIKSYRSAADKMLDAFNKNHHLTESQQYELDKNNAIRNKRDHVINTPAASQDKHWDDF